MELTLPGTTIAAGRLETDAAKTLLGYIFGGGPLTLSQVTTMTGLEPYTVQNWVKRGFLTKPEHKTYNRDQFARMIMMNLLRDAMQLDEIVRLFSYINGALDDTSDDRIADFTLYNLFVNLLVRLHGETGETAVRAAAGEILPAEMDATTRRYTTDVLCIMIDAYVSATLRRRVQTALRGLDRQTERSESQ